MPQLFVDVETCFCSGSLGFCYTLGRGRQPDQHPIQTLGAKSPGSLSGWNLIPAAHPPSPTTQLHFKGQSKDTLIGLKIKKKLSAFFLGDVCSLPSASHPGSCPQILYNTHPFSDFDPHVTPHHSADSDLDLVHASVSFIKTFPKYFYHTLKT